MIEIIENSVQLALLAALTVVTAMLSVRDKRTEGGLLAMFYGSYALGDLYWLLYLVYYGHTPRVFYIPDLSWYASYIFLYMLLRQIAPPKDAREKRILPWLCFVFTLSMAVFFMKESGGEIGNNLIYGSLMGLLMFSAVRRLMDRDAGCRTLCIVILVFCLLEYAMWTVSVFFKGDTLANPYYWFDFLLTVSFPAFLSAAKRTVAE